MQGTESTVEDTLELKVSPWKCYKSLVFILFAKSIPMAKSDINEARKSSLLSPRSPPGSTANIWEVYGIRYECLFVVSKNYGLFSLFSG